MRNKRWLVVIAVAGLMFSGWALAQSLSVFPYDKGIRVQDHGSPSAPSLATQARGVNCLGGASCYVDGGWWFLDLANDGGGSSGAPTNASYITEVSEPGLSNEFAMASLGTGLVKNATTTGVPSIYGGTSCTNQFPRSLNASGAATCASVSLSADVSGTLPQGNGGTGAGALTCTSGQCLTSNGSAYSCTSSITANDLACSSCVTLTSEVTGVLPVANGGTGSAPAADDQVLVSDSTSAATWRSVPDCTDTGGGHLNYTASTNGWSCGTSQLHDVGGSSPQVQYNNSGAFGGMTNFLSDGTRPEVVAETSHPSAPGTADHSLVYQWLVATGMPVQPEYIDNTMGLPMPEGALANYSLLGTVANWRTSCCIPKGFGSGTWTDVGPAGAACSTFAGSSGATTGPAWASTDLRTRSPTVQQATNSGVGQGVTMGHAALYFWRGNGSGAGGFFFWTRAFIVTAINGSTSSHRMFVGVASRTTFLNNVEPSTIADTAYFGHDSWGTTLSVCSNDNSGSATCSGLGANYPSVGGAWYDFYIWAKPDDTHMYYAVVRLDSAFATAGEFASGDLPRNTVQLTENLGYGTGSPDGGVMTMAFGGSCVAWNY